MANPKPSGSNPLVDELIKQFSTQAALLAGFAFAGLTAISYDPLASRRLVVAFGIVASLSIVLQLLTLFLFGMVGVVVREDQNHDLYDPEITWAWICFLGGVACLLASIALLAWIKIRPAALPITCIVVIAGIAMAVGYYRIGSKS
jgi:amino acid transporter